MTEQLPASGASNQLDASLNEAGQQGPAGGAPAAAGPNTDPETLQVRSAVECAPAEASSAADAGAHSLPISEIVQEPMLDEGATGEASPPPKPSHPLPLSASSPLGSHQGEGACSPADEPDPQPSAGSQHAPHTTFGGVPVRAMEDVMACRHNQIVTHGHTPEKDREKPLWLPREYDAHGRRSIMREIAHQFRTANEYAAFGTPKREVLRRALVRLAALCLAAIDWIDAEAAADGREP